MSGNKTTSFWGRWALAALMALATGAAGSVTARQPYVLHIPLFWSESGQHRLYLPLYAAGGEAGGSSARELLSAGAPVPERRSFVTRQGPDLALDGQAYTFTGTNAIYLAGPFFPEDKVEAILARLHEANVDVVRVWVEPWCDLSRVARLLDLGKQYDLRFVFTLRDFYGQLDGHWFRGRYRDEDLPHIRNIVPLLADRPEILMWELMNEPTCPGSDTGADCWDALVRWAKATSAEIKRLDSNHLVAVGTLDAGFTDLSREAFRRLHALPTVDVVSVHRPIVGWPEQELSIGRELDKPVYFGEIHAVGHDESCQPLSDEVLARRAQAIADDIARSRQAGVDGYLLWQYAYGAVDMGTHTEYFCGVLEYYGDDPVWDKIRSLPRAPIR